MKNIGKPCTGKPYARFDEGGLVMVSMDGLLRHRRTKVAETDRPIPNGDRSLSSTLPFPLIVTMVEASGKALKSLNVEMPPLLFFTIPAGMRCF